MQAASDNSWLRYPAATASATSYTANNLNQYSAVGAVTPTYDTNGSLTGDGTFTYAYDVESRLASIKLGASTVAAYGYDAQGEQDGGIIDHPLRHRRGGPGRAGL